MTEIDVGQEYIKTLEENIHNLTKTKLVLDTNVTVLNKILEGKDKKITELGEIIISKDDDYNKSKTHLENELRKISETLGFKNSDLRTANELNKSLKEEIKQLQEELKNNQEEIFSLKSVPIKKKKIKENGIDLSG